MKALVFVDGGAAVRVLADSSLARNGQPWFLPDAGGEWKWSTARALRISRLGKGIRKEFAHRYVDARTLLWLPGSSEPLAEADYMDGAAVVGAWVPLTEGSLTEAERELIVRASALSTLKNGDILAVMESKTPVPIEGPGKITADLDGETVIEFNVR